MNDNKVCIGIDIGINNINVSHSHIINLRNCVERIENKYGDYSTPAIVSYTSNPLLVGKTAVNQQNYNLNTLSNTIYDIKNLIGRKYDDPLVQKISKTEFYNLEKDAQGSPLIAVNNMGKSSKITPENIYTEFFKTIIDIVKNKTYKSIDRGIDKCVITYPDYFNANQIDSIKQAASVAGLTNNCSYFTESVASVVYYQNLNDVVDNGLFLVCSLGAGIFYVSIVEANNSTYTIKSVASNESIMGKDIDTLISLELLRRFKTKNPLLNPSNNPLSIYNLMIASQNAKHILSTHTVTTIMINSFYSNKNIKEDLTQSQLECLCSDFMNQFKDCISNALTQANIDKSSINYLILTGGSSHIEFIKQEIIQYFDDKKPLDMSHSEEAISNGAAMICERLANNQSLTVFNDNKINIIQYVEKNIENIIEIPTSYFFGIIDKSVDGKEKLLSKNNIVPQSYDIQFTTKRDKQKTADLDLYISPLLNENDKVMFCHLIIRDFPSKPAGILKVLIKIKIDEDKSINISASCKFGNNQYEECRIDSINVLKNGHKIANITNIERKHLKIQLNYDQIKEALQ